MTLSKMLTTVGRHQRAIDRLYRGEVRFDGDEPLFDTPLVVMAFTNRSGSHMLADMMIQTNRIRGFGEFLNADVVANMKAKFATESFPDHIAALRRSLCGPKQIFGIKASWDQLLMLLRWNVPAMFSGIRVIHIMRNDMLAQAVSHSIALQTRKWTSRHDDSGQTPDFRPKEIERLIDQNARADEMIRLITQAYDLPYARAVYEGLCRRPQDQMPHLLAFSGIGAGLWKGQQPERFEKQADATNADFIRRMQEHFKAATTQETRIPYLLRIRR